MKLAPEDKYLTLRAMDQFEQNFTWNFGIRLQDFGFTYDSASDLREFRELIEEAKRALRALPDADGGELDDRFAGLLREIIIHERLRAARNAEARQAHTTHPELLQQIDAQLQPYTALMARAWFKEAPPLRVPQFSDYFPIKDVEKQLAESADGAPHLERLYDEKFHILQAPSLFLPDLDRARAASRVRNVSVAVAYLDIDYFKKLNALRGEPFVDRKVLPYFMRRLEAHVYMRGYAYRFGGDEYVILLNNTSPSEALDSLDRLRASLAEMSYEGVSRPVTVSIGLVLVTPACHLTGREIEERAAEAKAHAKAKGRNRIAGYSDPWFEELTVLPRRSRRQSRR